MPKSESDLELELRAERIGEAIASLEQIRSSIETSGEVAPPGCHVARYQASGKKHRYWYYQLRATEAIFPKTNTEHEFSRYQHLGKAGSVAHIDGVQAVVRRGQIEVLTQAIEALKESWLDLYSNEKKAGHRVE